MNDWKSQLTEDPLPWLLEPDEANPGVRYFVLRDLLDRPADDPEVVAAQAEVMRTGPVLAILDAQYPDGYWVKPGPGYSPKYRSTLWSVLFLAQFGADGRDVRIRRAVDHVFAHAQAAKAEAERELLTRTDRLEIAEAQAKLAEAVAQLRALEQLRRKLRRR